MNPTLVNPLLLNHEKKVEAQTYAENPAEVRVLGNALRLFDAGFASLPEIRTNDVRVETAQLLALASQAFRWSTDLAIKGYYNLSVSLSRTVWECWLNGTYLNVYPDRKEAWKNFKTRPSPSEMRRLVAVRSHPDDAGKQRLLKGAMDELYQGSPGERFSGYSAFSHPTSDALRVMISDGPILNVAPVYDWLQFRHAAFRASSAAGLALLLFLYLLEEDVGSRFQREIEAHDAAHANMTAKHDAELRKRQI